jgi:hypothetical protein
LAEASKTEKWAALASTLAAAGSLANLFKNGRAAAQVTGEFPPEVLTLLQELAAGVGTTIEQLNEIITAIGGISGGGGGGVVQGYPPNCDSMAIAVVNCELANTAYPVPDYTVPDGFSVVIKSHPSNAFGSLVYWSTSPSPNTNSASPLQPNDRDTAALKKTGDIRVFSNIAGSLAVIYIEQRRSS